MSEDLVQSEGGAVATWEDRLSRMAAAVVETESAGAGGKFISTKSGMLSFDGQPFMDNKLDCIIVASCLENHFYEAKFDPDNPSSPVCYAFAQIDETMTDVQQKAVLADMRPHEKASKPQAATCAECPQNEFGTADNGKGKACKNIRRLGLVPADNLTTEGINKSEPAYLKVPVTSVKGWAVHARTIAALYKMPPLGVITTVSIKPDMKTQFKVCFDVKAPVGRELMPALLNKYDVVREMIEFPYTEYKEGAEEAAPAKKPGKAKKF